MSCASTTLSETCVSSMQAGYLLRGIEILLKPPAHLGGGGSGHDHCRPARRSWWCPARRSWCVAAGQGPARDIGCMWCGTHDAGSHGRHSDGGEDLMCVGGEGGNSIVWHLPAIPYASIAISLVWPWWDIGRRRGRSLCKERRRERSGGKKRGLPKVACTTCVRAESDADRSKPVVLLKFSIAHAAHECDLASSAAACAWALTVLQNIGQGRST